MEFNDRELLARIIQCEAGGEGDNGMRAVASVVMNRVHVAGGEYLKTGQGNLRNVIFQPGQFDCVRSIVGGQINMQTIYNESPEQIHYDIADWALGGGILNAVGESLWYLNPFGQCMSTFPYNGSGTLHTRVVQHCFYRPTSIYWQT